MAGEHTLVRPRVKGKTMIKQTYIPQVMTHPKINFLHIVVLRYGPDKILKIKVTTARPKAKSRSHNDIQTLINVHTKYQPSTTYTP